MKLCEYVNSDTENTCFASEKSLSKYSSDLSSCGHVVLFVLVNSGLKSLKESLCLDSQAA